MWRINSDDWERKKNYLIRSLFHDLPLLSPVPESRESSCSPNGASSRPCSPLPPLIIERMPNRHDEPPEFYSELERKMKKVYKNLLYNEDSTSIDSLLDRYGRDYVTHDSRSVGIEDHRVEATSSTTNVDSDDENIDFVTAIEAKSKDATAETTVSGRKRNDNNNLSFGDDETRDQVTNLIDNDDHQSDADTPVVSMQVTIQATVHTPPLNLQGDNQHFEHGYHSPTYSEEDFDKSLSPVLTCQSLLKKNSGNIERKEAKRDAASKEPPPPRVNSQEVQTPEDQESSEPDPRPQDETQAEEEEEKVTSDTNETSIGFEDFRRMQQNKSPSRGRFSDINNHFTDGVEIMRRQRTISPSLGSLQDCQDDELDTTFNKNIGFNRRTSYDIYSNSQDSTTEVDEREVAFQHDNFSNILNTPSPKNKRKWQHLSNKRLNELFAANENEFVTKRLKSKDTGAQTSVVGDENDTSDWDYLKSNFFVGVPKVYKLCTCKNHSCGDIN